MDIHVYKDKAAKIQSQLEKMPVSSQDKSPDLPTDLSPLAVSVVLVVGIVVFLIGYVTWWGFQ